MVGVILNAVWKTTTNKRKGPVMLVARDPSVEFKTGISIWRFLHKICVCTYFAWGFPGGTSGKEPAVNAGDIRDKGSITGLRRSPGEGNGNPLQYSCLENPMDREA